MSNLKFSVNRNKIKVSEKDIKKIDNIDQCHFCKIDISKHSHIHARENEVVKTCSLCYQIEHLDNFYSMDKGCVILLPEISQVELFGLVRQIWFIQSLEQDESNNPYEESIDSVKNLLRLLEDRKDLASTYYAQSVENVQMITNFLHSIDDESYSQRDKGLNFLRWLPDKNAFKEEVEFWNNNELKKYHPKNFKKIIKKVAGVVSQKNKKG